MRCSGWAAAGAQGMRPARIRGGIWRRWKRRFCFCSVSGRRSAIVTRTSAFPQAETGGACRRRKFPGPLSAARSDAPGTRLFHRVLLGPWPHGGRAGVPAAGILSGAFHAVFTAGAGTRPPAAGIESQAGICCRTGGGHPLPLMKDRGECVWTST